MLEPGVLGGRQGLRGMRPGERAFMPCHLRSEAKGAADMLAFGCVWQGWERDSG